MHCGSQTRALEAFGIVRRLLTCRETASPAVVVSQTRVSSRDPVLTAGRDAVNRRAEGAFASGWNDQEEDRWPALDGGHVRVTPR